MSEKKIVFIVGAGASKEIGLPTGNKLKETIAKCFDIDYEFDNQKNGSKLIVQALESHYLQEGNRPIIEPYLQAGLKIRDAMPQEISIDNFIDKNSEDKKIELCGKLAIVHSILDAERNSKLYFDSSNCENKLNFSDIEDTWYMNFWKLLFVNCKKKDISTRLKKIALIVFNYDRCIEHYLFNSLMNNYYIQAGEAANIINEMEIYHPYGTVGSLPWQDGQSIEYGAIPNGKQLLTLSNQIKTFTEGTDTDSSEILNIHDNISKAEKIVFLGFAYHKLNLKLLSLDERDGNIKKGSSICYGTAFGKSDSDCETIKSELNNSYYTGINKIFINNKLKCADLFYEYERSLSFD
jgi:hypothetical protein